MVSLPSSTRIGLSLAMPRVPGTPWRCGDRARSRPAPPPGGTAAAAVDDHRVRRPAPSRSTPAARRPAAVAPSLSLSLTLQLGEAIEPRGALGTSGDDAQIGYSSIMRGARSAGTSTPLSATDRPAPRYRLPARLPARRCVRAHIDRRPCHAESRIGRCLPGLTPTLRITRCGARHQQRGDERKGRRGLGSPGTVSVAGFKLRLTGNGDRAAAVRVRLDADARRRRWRSMRSVWSRARRGLDDTGFPRRVEAGEQHRRLHLRRGHRQPILDRQRLVSADQRERQPAAAACHKLPRPSVPAVR